MSERSSLSRLGEALRKARTEAGLSQEELATKVGVSRTTISSYELGNSLPTLDVATAVVLALGRDIVVDGCRMGADKGILIPVEPQSQQLLLEFEKDHPFEAKFTVSSVGKKIRISAEAAIREKTA